MDSNQNQLAQPGAEITDDQAELLRAQQEQLKAVEKIQSLPAVQLPMKFVTNKTLTTSVETLLKHPNSNIALYCELSWFVFFIVFRAWRKSKHGSSNWLEALWTHLWTMVLFIAGASFAIPYLLYGDEYKKILQTVLQIVRSSTGL